MRHSGLVENYFVECILDKEQVVQKAEWILKTTLFTVIIYVGLMSNVKSTQVFIHKKVFMFSILYVMAICMSYVMFV